MTKQKEVRFNGNRGNGLNPPLQRLALDVQHENAVAVLGTDPLTRDWGEIGFLP